MTHPPQKMYSHVYFFQAGMKAHVIIILTFDEYKMIALYKLTIDT